MYYFEEIRNCYLTTRNRSNFDQFYAMVYLEFIWAEWCNSVMSVIVMEYTWMVSGR